MIRTDNQDSYAFDILTDNILYAVVCDGMGGASGGKTASNTAVNVFSSDISSICNCNLDEEIHNILNNTISHANKEIYLKSLEEDRKSVV